MMPQDAPINLSAVALFRQELAQLEGTKTLTETEKNALVARAQSGDRAARSAILNYLLPRIAWYASRYAAAYSWDSHQLDYLDLVQTSCEAMLSALDRALDHAANVYASLLSTARGAICRYAKRYGTLITSPSTPGVTPLSVESLDAPLYWDDDQTLLDLIAEATDENYEDYVLDYGSLYEAIRRLPLCLRAAIVQSFSLFLGDPAWEAERTYPVKNLSSGRSKALDVLYSLLATFYPQYCSSVTRPVQKREPLWKQEGRDLTEQERTRLDQAREALLARGEPLTHANLAREAHIGGSQVLSRYLSEVKAPKVDREQRLAEAYERLMAEGVAFGVRRLAKEAGVQWVVARGYLESNPPPSPEERVKQAYDRLEANGEPITVHSLTKAARIGIHFVQRWLPAYRQANGYVPVRQGRVLYWVKADAKSVASVGVACQA
jgi:DNA-directed RNA polymerase specialized sigma24 family protein